MREHPDKLVLDVVPGHAPSPLPPVRIFLGTEEGVRKRGLVSINSGWLARGGLMRVYTDRLEFEPNPLEKLLAARRPPLPYADIVRIERRPAGVNDVSPVGEAKRMRLHLREGRTLDVLPPGDTLDEWMVAVLEPWTWWRRANIRDEEDA